MHLIYDRARQKCALYRRIIADFSERMIANESDRERLAVDRYYAETQVPNSTEHRATRVTQYGPGQRTHDFDRRIALRRKPETIAPESSNPWSANNRDAGSGTAEAATRIVSAPGGASVTC